MGTSKTQVSMVDITAKPDVFREALASGSIRLKSITVQRIKEGKIEKGDPLETAKIAGILAAKNTSHTLPLCHPLPLTHVEVRTKIENHNTVSVQTVVRAKAKTGVEMEALSATAAALLTIWDMTKQYEKDANGQYPTTRITKILVEKKIKEKNL